MNLTRTVQCRIARKNRWSNNASVLMGISFFLRCGYYFGLTNLNDVPFFESIMRVWLPLLLAAAFLLPLEVQRLRLTAPIAGVVVAAIAVDYFFAAQMSTSGVISGILLLAYAALFLMTCLGYIPRRAIVMLAAALTAAFRLLFVDLFGYMFPISDFQPVAWLPECANLFSVLAVTSLSPALRVQPIKAEYE